MRLLHEDDFSQFLRVCKSGTYFWITLFSKFYLKSLEDCHVKFPHNFIKNLPKFYKNFAQILLILYSDLIKNLPKFYQNFT